MASNILVGIVDFNRMARDTYAALLQIELGLRIIDASSGTQLLERLEGETPDLLLVGPCRTPIGDSLGAIETLNARFPRAPVIAIGRHYPTLGADGVIDEPVDAAELVGMAWSLLPKMLA